MLPVMLICVLCFCMVLKYKLRTIESKEKQQTEELIRLENETEDPSRLAVLLEENRMALGRENQRLEAIKTAMTALSEAGEDLRSSLSPILRSKAEGYMSFVTDSKYSSLGIDTDYTLSAKTDFGVRPVSLLSAGTRDVAYLALRLALSEVIFGDIAPFVALDESLSQLDDKRAAAALRMLSAYCGRGGQCLLFTCHTREYELLKNITDANLIRL